MLESEQQPINHLLVVEDKQGKRTIALETATYSIGRDPSNSIVLDSRLASRHHAILLRVTTPDTANHLFRIIDGNLQGKRSTNGLIVNGKRCSSHNLKHGDVIVFGDAKAKYYATVYHSNEDLELYSPEDVSGFFSNLNSSLQTQINNPFQTQIGSNSDIDDSSEAALVRLASFPELISNPILEINLAGSITYLNPAAVVQFPDIRAAKLEHPILAGVVSKLKNDKEKFFIREVEVANKVFEQSVHYIAESDLIRSYLVDVTERKQLQAILQLAHNKLETRVEERTTELQKANEQLRREIVERRRAEEEVRFLQTMMQAIAESTNFDSALEVVLRKVCEFTGWKFGEAWIPNSDGTALECSPAWYGYSHNLDHFRKSSTGYTFPPATGIPGRVWLSKQTEWIQDVSSQPETVFLRKQFLQEAGFKAGLGIPIIDSNQVLAVLVFFMFEACEEDNRLVELVTTVSTQLGSLIQRKQAEKALRDSEKRFRAAFNQAAVGIAHVSPEGKWLLVNQKLCDIVGYSQAELLDLTFPEITHPDDLNTNLEYARQLLAQEIQTYSMEKRYIRKDGSSISANITVSLVRDSLGKPKYFIVVVEDIWKRKQAEAALQESEKRFRSAFNQAAVGIAHVSPEGKWLLVNQKLCDIVGYSQEELLELTFQEITYPDDLNTDLDYVRQILADEIQTYSMEKRYIRKDGCPIWINLTVSLVRDASEAPKYFIGVIEDISERKQAEQALHSSYATNRALLNAIPDLMFRLNKNGIFVNFKAAKDVTLPLVAEEFLGKHLYEVFPTELADSAMNCVQSALSTGKVQVFEAQLLVNNHPCDYEFRFAVSAKNEAIAIVRDITQRKQAEAEVHKALEKEKELGELKSRFVTMASHEFRTPLATILSSTELLEHYSHKWSEEKKLNHFQRIQAAVKQMTGLLNDVLLIGKAEAGKLEFKPKPIDLFKFCTEIVEEIQITTSTHIIDFCSHGESANGLLDEKLLRHILTNLLSNAVKYSPQGGTVHFNLKCDRTEAVLQIQDAGIGIPPADLEKLFETFHRASNVGTISGTGLGLAIVKKSVELHKGTITVESTVGAGTTFTVKIPLSLVEENMRSVSKIH